MQASGKALKVKKDEILEPGVPQVRFWDRIFITNTRDYSFIQ